MEGHPDPTEDGAPPQPLHQVRAAGERLGFRFGESAGRGGYSILLDVTAGRFPLPAVMKVPAPPPPRRHAEGLPPIPWRPFLVSETGPFSAEAVTDAAAIDGMLRAAATRQAANPCSVLATLHGLVDLEGVPVAFYEKLVTPCLADMAPDPQRLGVIARWAAEALGKLHSEFGPHGDFKPAHVFVDEAHSCVRLVDPIDSRVPPPGADSHLIGSPGFTLFAARAFGIEDGAFADDVGALAATVSQGLGSPLRWERLIEPLLNHGNGRFGPGPGYFEEQRQRAAADLGRLDGELARWCERTALEYFDACVGNGSLPGESGKEWARGRLETLRNLDRP